MLKVHILVRCTYCNGQAYLPTREAVDLDGNPYMKHRPCHYCLGTGTQDRWIDLTEFASLLEDATCSYSHSALQGSYHFSDGEVWDDIIEVCRDCGANLDKLERT